MTFNQIGTKKLRKRNLFLALHSCSTTFGVATLNSKTPEKICRSLFPVGRNLSNSIVTCIEKVLPPTYWHEINRISVAIGPGGFTGTRLSVVLARTLAQQLDCQLDGISNFSLMAPRLVKKINKPIQEKNFWITKDLPRKGTIGGMYKIQKTKNELNLEEVLELKSPHLLKEEINNLNHISASDDVETDIERLLKLSFLAGIMGQ